jgi:hypothetical protein
VTQAQKLTGKSRRTLYRDMAVGRVSWRNNQNGHREIETSELLRVYGPLADSGTEERHIVAHPDGTQSQAELLAEIRALRQDVADLRSVILRIEDKTVNNLPEQAVLPSPWWRFWQKK